jgi:acyl-CoA synthetase (AMP-forming)/AMP-acid ligase II
MVLRSPYPDVQVPDVSLTEYVLGGAAARGDKPALVDGATGEVTTYAQLAERVGAVAAALAADGIGKGDVVALLSPNTPAWPVAYHAVIALGAIVTAINPALTPDEIAEQLRSAGAKAAIAAEPLRPALAPAGLQRVYPLESLPAGSGTPEPAPIDPASDLAALPFSSGTTGLSKPVMLTHRNLVANMEQIRAVHRIGGDDVLVGMLPFFHIYGQVVVLNLGLSQGATIVTMARFELGAFLDLLELHRVTRAHVAPPVVLGLAKAPGVERRDLALEVVISGAAPLDADTANRASERLGAPVRQGYGMTEASPVTHIASDDGLADQDPGAIGHLAPSTEGRLVDPETGEDTDGDGEIWIRGPQVMRGYLADDEATAATLTEDGWLKTGDVARVDEDGVWRIVDRVKELIKYKGYQVPPAELEALLIGHPAVADAAVIPIPDEAGGEAPKACVVAAGDLDPEELMAWVAESVAPYKRIRAVELVDEIPRSPSGKILRRLLRDRPAGQAR